MNLEKLSVVLENTLKTNEKKFELINIAVHIV